ncbi:tetratricopeptide repeat protein 23 [Narcine bancroftii]|uniref:tetratricopeptide repeat protein 23 n=1 Tax=Narcine bancroftii TaxID=1343680 RepID=UPI0038321153
MKQKRRLERLTNESHRHNNTFTMPIHLSIHTSLGCGKSIQWKPTWLHGARANSKRTAQQLRIEPGLDINDERTKCLLGHFKRYCDSGTSSGGSEVPSKQSRGARLRWKQRNALKEVAVTVLPEDKLAQAEQRAKMYCAIREEVPAVQELMRCVALARISFGDFHWRMARAHINLAEGYLELKGQTLQAKQHCNKAKDIMYANTQHPESEEERREILRCLITMFLTLGRALMGLENLKEAEQSLLKSEKVVHELRQVEEETQETRQVDTKINLSLGRLHMKERRWDKAVASYQKALWLVQLDEGEKSMVCVSIYQDLAAAELARSGHDVSLQYLLQAHSIVLTNAPSAEEEGKITLALAEAYTSADRAEDHADTAELYYKKSLQCYQATLGPEHPSSLSVLDSYSRFLIMNKNYLAASKLLQGSLPAKRSSFGDFSTEVEEAYRLLGGIELAQGHQKLAFRKFKKGKGNSLDLSRKLAIFSLIERRKLEGFSRSYSSHGQSLFQVRTFISSVESSDKSLQCQCPCVTTISLGSLLKSRSVKSVLRQLGYFQMIIFLLEIIASEVSVAQKTFFKSSHYD